MWDLAFWTLFISVNFLGIGQRRGQGALAHGKLARNGLEKNGSGVSGGGGGSSPGPLAPLSGLPVWSSSGLWHQWWCWLSEWGWLGRLLWLALAAGGSLAVSRAGSSFRKRLPRTEKQQQQQQQQQGRLDNGGGRSGLTLALDRRALEMFSAVHWGAIKGMMMVMGPMESFLDNATLPKEQLPLLKAGLALLRRMDSEHSALLAESQQLKGELAAIRERASTLAQENATLRARLAVATEHELIIEQDRKQIHALLEDKGRLQEDNHRLEREIAALQELLEYAEEQCLEEEGLDEITRRELGFESFEEGEFSEEEVEEEEEGFEEGDIDSEGSVLEYQYE